VVFVREGTAVAFNGKYYAIGGQDYYALGDGETLDVYDPATGTWTTKAPLHTGRYQAASAVIGDKIYVFAGADTAGHALSDIEVYDPATDTWTVGGQLTGPRVGMGAAAVVRRNGNTVVYLIGGAGEGFIPSYDINELFEPGHATPLTRGTADRPPGPRIGIN
jgi:N-acetylneuraminic acid mutarotase